MKARLLTARTIRLGSNGRLSRSVLNAWSLSRSAAHSIESCCSRSRLIDAASVGPTCTEPGNRCAGDQAAQHPGCVLYSMETRSWATGVGTNGIDECPRKSQGTARTEAGSTRYRRDQLYRFPMTSRICWGDRTPRRILDPLHRFPEPCGHSAFQPSPKLISGGP